MIIQIYEIQTPQEARALVELGVDHIGSVIQDNARWNAPVIKDVIGAVRKTPAKSSLIPLFNNPDAVYRVLGHLRPDILHLCESLLLCSTEELERLQHLQQGMREAFPAVAMMRTIPVPAGPHDAGEKVLALARRFEPVSDFFLIDTHAPHSPVAGFTGITGKPCDWELAAGVVRQSGIPVILAGGLGPENVMEAIRAVRPAGVDSCTGTNARDSDAMPIRFQKDLRRVRCFVDQVRSAQKALASFPGMKNTA
ncbi:MAG: phosphoribosylanthranilate isomerase [Deltaproteobacteria bacterium]|nr:phosphoribosylanthranilate isomerase [Deltaproteobacteria bacterium]